LSARQKASLGKLAHAAYVFQRNLGLADGDEPAWRHDQVRQAVGVDGLRDASNSHYRALKSHFLALAGQPEKSFSVAMDTGINGGPDGETVEDHDQALWLVRDYCARNGISLRYPETIAARNFRRRSLDSCSSGQLRSILITVTRHGTPRA
jgi:hypothetical protein